MQRLALVVATLSLLPTAALANDPHAAHGSHGKPAQVAPSGLADGMVKKIDQTSGMLTLAHGPLPNGMGAMTMAFKVKDRALLSKVKDGQKIRFAIDEAMNITHIE